MYDCHLRLAEYKHQQRLSALSQAVSTFCEESAAARHATLASITSSILFAISTAISNATVTHITVLDNEQPTAIIRPTDTLNTIVTPSSLDAIDTATPAAESPMHAEPFVSLAIDTAVAPAIKLAPIACASDSPAHVDAANPSAPAVTTIQTFTTTDKRQSRLAFDLLQHVMRPYFSLVALRLVVLPLVASSLFFYVHSTLFDDADGRKRPPTYSEL